MSEALEKHLVHLNKEVEEIMASPEWGGKDYKEAVKEALKPLIFSSAAVSQKNDDQTKTSGRNKSLPDYLKNAPDDLKIKVEELVNLVFSEGLEKTVKRARENTPFILDAFHDALADKFYDELKKRALIS